MNIGFTGFDQVGKDTAADFCLWYYRRFNPVLKCAFADEAKKDLAIPIAKCLQEGLSKEQIRPMITAYTEAIRHKDSMYWINRFSSLDRISQSRFFTSGQRASNMDFFSDIRTKEEVEWLKQTDPRTKIIRIIRDGCETTNTAEATIEIVEADCCIYNNFSKLHLYNRIIEAIVSFFGKEYL